MPVNRYGPWLLGLLFIVVLLAALHFLALDRCMDGGGAVVRGLSCDTGAGQPVSLFSYASLFDALLSAIIAAIPVGLILSIVHSSRGRE